MTSIDQYAPTGPSPEERQAAVKTIEGLLANSRPTSWYELRYTREYAAEWLSWSEDKLAEVDAILARNSQASRERETRRRQAQELQRMTDMVVREMKQAEEDKLRAKAVKIARERLGL